MQKHFIDRSSSIGPGNKPGSQFLNITDQRPDIELDVVQAIVAAFPAGARKNDADPVTAPSQIKVCNGTVCRMSGTQGEIRDFLKAHFPDQSIEEADCLGRCHENRAFQYNGITYSGSDMDRVGDVKDGQERDSSYRVGSYGRSLLVKSVSKRINSLALMGLLLNSEPIELMGELETSRFRCRGQSGIPMVEKLLPLYYTEANRKLVICNAGAGGPGTYTDRYLMEQKPKKIIWGMILAGHLIGAREGVIYLSNAFPKSIRQLEKTIKNMEGAGLLGAELFGSGFRFDIHLVISGSLQTSSTGMTEAEGSAFQQTPMLFANPETLSNLFHIFAIGGENYAKIGTPLSTGTKLMSLDSSFRKPGIYEVEMGTPLRVLIDGLGGGFKKPVQALHVGGKTGAIVPKRLIDTLRIDYETLGKKGIALSCNSIVGIPEDYDVDQYLSTLRNREVNAH